MDQSIICVDYISSVCSAFCMLRCFKGMSFLEFGNEFLLLLKCILHNMVLCCWENQILASFLGESNFDCRIYHLLVSKGVRESEVVSFPSYSGCSG